MSVGLCWYVAGPGGCWNTGLGGRDCTAWLKSIKYNSCLKGISNTDSYLVSERAADRRVGDRSWPTVTLVGEELSQDSHVGVSPSARWYRTRSDRDDRSIGSRC